MPHPSSIPPELHEAIVTRWLAGCSPTAIVAWIHETNATRAVPVQTSRSSIQRLLRLVSEKDALAARLQVVQRVWLLAPAVMDGLEDVASGYQAAVRETREPMSADAVKQLRVRLMAIGKAEMSLFRHLRIAGVTGAAADRLLKQHAPKIEQARAEMVAQEQRVEQGRPPEQRAVPVPSRPAQVTASVPEKAAKQAEMKRSPSPVASRIPPTDVPAALFDLLAERLAPGGGHLRSQA
jgi:hypothetical protein